MSNNNKSNTDCFSSSSRWTNKRKARKQAEEEMAEFLPQLKRLHPDLQNQSTTNEVAVYPEITGNPVEGNHQHASVDSIGLPNVSINSGNGSSESDTEAEEMSEDCAVISEIHPSIYLPLLCISNYLRHHMTKVALRDYLLTLRIASNCPFKELTSVHNLLSKYEHANKAATKKIWVCNRDKCDQVLLTSVLKKRETPNTVQPCGHRYCADDKKDCYILFLPIRKQIEYFIRHHGLSQEKWDEDPNFRGDVNTGECYRTLRNDGSINEFTITLQLNLDGASCFKVSKFGFWPFMAIINEASYKKRRGFVILLALWFGNKKPPRKGLMDPVIEELRVLQEEGIFVDGITYKVKVLIVTTDTVARPIPWNVGQFNGVSGCNICLMPGIRVKKGRGSVRVYPEPQNGEPSAELRTLEQHTRDMKDVIATKKEKNGIRGETPFVHLPNFDYVKACVPEYMHGSCLGVLKQFLKLFFTGKKSQGAWFIGSKIKLVNLRLKNMKPPNEITRSLGQVDDFPNWKASMYRSFGLYFFVVLEDLLPPEYFDHFSSLVYGLNVLLQERVSVSDVKNVGILFKKFVKDAEFLYGVKEISINIHFLTHLSQCVLDWGCLWSYSTFIPEWFNGELLGLKNGSQEVTQQMANNYLLKMNIRDTVFNLQKNEDSCFPSHVCNFFGDLLNLPIGPYEPGLSVNGGTIKLLGRSVASTLDFHEEIAVINYLKCDPSYIDEVVFQQYYRFKIISTGSIFTSFSYKRSPKRVNYGALLSDSVFIRICKILYLPNSQQAILIVKEMGNLSKQTFLPRPIDGVVFSSLPGQTTKLTGIKLIPFAIDPVKIVSKCVFGMNQEDAEIFIVTALVNKFETD